jgi:hypothetical protein
MAWNFSQLFDLLTISKSSQSTFLFAGRPITVISNRSGTGASGLQSRPNGKARNFYKTGQLPLGQ